MKTKIISFLWPALLCAMTLATGAFADTEAGFYEKDHIHGFISIGADYRGMFSEYQNYVNRTAFLNGYHKDPSGDSTKYAGNLNYETFDDYYFGMHVNIGAQYKQFLTWFDINFMPTQTSERPSKTYTAQSEDGSTTMKFPLYDVRWFAYGADWMFGWKLFGENTFINLIPAVGFGFNLINFHLLPLSTLNWSCVWNLVLSLWVHTVATAASAITSWKLRARKLIRPMVTTIPTMSAIPGSLACVSPGSSAVNGRRSSKTSCNLCPA